MDQDKSTTYLQVQNVLYGESMMDIYNILYILYSKSLSCDDKCNFYLNRIYLWQNSCILKMQWRSIALYYTLYAYSMCVIAAVPIMDRLHE